MVEAPAEPTGDASGCVKASCGLPAAPGVDGVRAAPAGSARSHAPSSVAVSTWCHCMAPATAGAAEASSRRGNCACQQLPGSARTPKKSDPGSSSSSSPLLPPSSSMLLLPWARPGPEGPSLPGRSAASAAPEPRAGRPRKGLVAPCPAAAAVVAAAAAQLAPADGAAPAAWNQPSSDQWLEDSHQASSSARLLLPAERLQLGRRWRARRCGRPPSAPLCSPPSLPAKAGPRASSAKARFREGWRRAPPPPLLREAQH